MEELGVSGEKSTRWRADQLKPFLVPNHVRKKVIPERGTGRRKGPEARVHLHLGAQGR